ncbi:MAG: 4-hydroxy-tetrahydrodipicolinate synthase [Smithella sp.]
MFYKEQYGKRLVPIVTPFKNDMSVDYDALLEIGEILIKRNYADSFILTGTTGEFFTMNFDERVKIFEIMKKQFGGKIPLIPHTGAASTKEAIALTQKAKELGYETAMIVAPYYTKPSQKELITHFSLIADAVNINIMLYNIPIFTGVNIEPTSLKQIIQKKNIVAIKEEAELRPKQISEYLLATPESFIVYCGDDTMVLEALAQGGDRIGGFVSGGCHLFGDKMKTMIDLFLSGKVLEAGKIQLSLLPLLRSLSQNGRSNPVCLLKAAMNLVGFPKCLPRLPLMPATEEEMVLVKREMQKAGILS